MTDQIEEWRDIEESFGIYQVSNLGRVKSLKRTCMTYQGPRTVPEKILKQILNRGYPQVALTINGKIYSRRVHRLLSIAFIPNPENKPTINHKNGITTDMSLDNLEWATFGENNMHACKTGLKVAPKGEKSGASKLTEKEAKEIKYGHFDKSYPKIGLIYGIKAPTVCNIRKGKIWKHI